MQSANKEILLSFFQNNYQYIIPFFQRSYVWDNENWEIFLEHLLEEVNAFKNGEESEHFIGTIITKPLPQQGLNTISLELVDGQQRLTTVAIIIKAIIDTSTGEYENLKDNLTKYLTFKDNKGEKYFRIIHSKNDAPHFNKVMNASDPSNFVNFDNQISKSYKYFYHAFKDITEDERDSISNVLMNRLPVISMFLSEKDDEQQIFDTINSLGMGLTISELLKNYIFREKALQSLYEDLWFNVFEEDEDTIRFWNEEKTSGRVKRTNLELLLYCFLITETGKDIRLEKLFSEYKKHLKNMDVDEKIQFLKDMKSCATLYSNFPSSSMLNEISFSDTENRVFHIIENVDITTVYPLLLSIYKLVPDKQEILLILEILESYLIRRLVCKLSTKNYNKLFIQIVRDLKNEGELNAEIFKNKLLSFDDDTNKFPNNIEFKKAWNESYLYNKYTRELLFIISLYRINNNLNDITKLSVKSYSVEHIMPKKWRENWLTTRMTEEQKSERDWTLKRIGNLTLVTSNLNSQLKNSAWSNKKVVLSQYSLLTITTNYLQARNWNEIAIESRGDDLFADALQIWKMP